MARPGLLLYFDVLPALDKLPRDAVGELLLGALRYAQDGVEPTFEDSSLEFAWAFLRPSIDRDGATYEEKRLRGDWLTYCRQRKKDGVDALDFETWRERVDNGTLRTVDVSLPTTTPTPSPSSTTSTTPAQEQLQPIDGAAAAPPALARDTRNIIFLSDEQYQGLAADLGEHELERCIDYLSEYCSMHNRKYGDWDAAVRKCSRERWGFPSSKPGSKGGTDFQPTADRIQKNNAWLDAFLAEQQKEDGGKLGNLPGVTRL